MWIKNVLDYKIGVIFFFNGYVYCICECCQGLVEIYGGVW